MTKLAKKIFARDKHGPGDWFWFLSLLLAGAGARLWLIHTFGTPLPFWDQWEHTRTVFLPYFEGRLSWAALFSPHNEHRIFFTRLYDLALLLWNGQWDNRVQMVANTFIYVTGMAGFGWFLARMIGRQFWPAIATTLLLALCLPFAWENTLAGFHSQVYFVILATLLTVWLLGFHEPGKPRWWLGVSMAFISLVTMGSGLIGSATVIALSALRVLRAPSVWKDQWPSVVVAAVAVGLGLALMVEVPYHQILKAHSVAEFLVSLGKYLAWPWIVLPPFAVFNIFPLLLLARLYLRNRETQMRCEEIILAIGLWAGIQAVASAYARGAGGAHPQWRYMDATCFVMIANVLSLLLLGTRHLERLPLRRHFRWGAALWALACVTGLLALSGRAWTVDIPARQTHHRFQLETLRAYLATGDSQYLQVDDKAKLSRFAAPNEPQDHAKAMMDMLKPPQVRAILPACVRDPLTMVAETATGLVTNGAAAVTPDIPGEISWSSFIDGAATKSRFESRPIAPGKLPFLEFRVAGDLGKPGLSLAIVEITSGKTTAINPRQPSGKAWQIFQIRSPRGDFKIVATDESETGWFAFQPPRELGRLSLWADRITASGMGLFIVGAGCFCAGIASVWAARRRIPMRLSADKQVRN